MAGERSALAYRCRGYPNPELTRFVTLAEMPATLANRALTLASLFRARSVYDFFFLALAEELGCELSTSGVNASGGRFRRRFRS